MKTKSALVGLVGTALLFGPLGLAACRATVAGDPDRPIKIEAHITIDVREVKETARSIEDIVSGQAPMPAQKPRSRLTDGFVSVAWAAAPELKTITPEVQKALDARRDRFGSLKSAKAQGFVGEDNQGHVAALGGGVELQVLVQSENGDRDLIYQAIIQQNNLPPDAIGTIRTAFAEVQREKAEAGEKIQFPSGEWKTK